MCFICGNENAKGPAHDKKVAAMVAERDRLFFDKLKNKIKDKRKVFDINFSFKTVKMA